MIITYISKAEIAKIMPLDKFFSELRNQFNNHKEWLDMSAKKQQKNWSKSTPIVDFGNGIIGYYADRKGLLTGRKGRGFYERTTTIAGNSVDYKIK